MSHKTVLRLVLAVVLAPALLSTISPHLLFAQATPTAMPADSLITPGFFGFDFWTRNLDFWQEVLAQMRRDSLSFGLVGTDGIHWEEIEPNPPSNGKHTYDWSGLDQAMVLVSQYGVELEVGLRTVSPWATVVPPGALVGASCCNMSPLKSDAASDTAAWGMTAAQAWYDFVYNLVERYDGDGIDDAPGIERPTIRHLMYGNEPDTYDHFFANQGTVREYHRALKIMYQAAKAADTAIVVLRGKMNPGNAFDDDPDLDTVLQQRNEQGSIDSLFAFLDFGGQFYDVFAINFNDHSTGLQPLVHMLTTAMQQRGYSKPFLVADARTTLYPRDNSSAEHILPPRYPAGYLAILDDPQHPDYLALKKTMQADEVRQSLRKILAALETGQRSISLQPVYSQADIDWAAGDRKAMWLYAGFFDPYLYESTGELARAREPVYYALKQLMDRLIASEKTAVRLELGDWVYAYRFRKQGEPFIIIWHENPWDVDAHGLVRRQQHITADLRPFLPGEELRLQHFITEVDENGDPVVWPDTLVAAAQVPFDETPVLVVSATTTGVPGEQGSLPGEFRLLQNYPNPFNPSTKIQFELPRRGEVQLHIFGLTGRQVYTLVAREMPAGLHTVTWRPEKSLPSGTYFLQLKFSGGRTLWQKLLFLK